MKRLLLLFTLVLSFNSQAQNNIPKRGFAVDWIMPKAMSNPLIMTFEKMELGVNMTDSIQQLIQSFITSGKGLNPYDPDDIDVKTQFYYQKDGNWVTDKFIFGFYFEDFKRSTKSAKIEDWNWIAQKTRDPFRIRFEADKAGKWKFEVTIKVKGKERAKLGPYEFSCEDSHSPGYVRVSDSKKHLQLGENTFLPIGQNLPKTSCYYQKDKDGKVLKDEYGCADCPCATVEEWCPHLRKLPMNPKAYMVYLQELEKYKENGANYFRMIIYQHTYEIEYEHLGNYSSRMHLAWEMDQLLTKCEQLDLKIHFDMFSGYPFTKAMYGVDLWDWYADNEKDSGYCYRSELGLKNPVDFLTDERAKSWYKKKLRYMIARYGYSHSIALFELVNEINNKFPGEYQKVYEWQKEMAQYIKYDLGHTQHPLVASYTGAPSKKDKSYSIKEIDIISHNIHRSTISRFDIAEAVDKLSKYGKPIVFSEIGTGDTEIDRCDSDCEWYKDLWMAVFSGEATVGLNWANDHRYDLWKNYKYVRLYMDEINFAEFTARYRKMSKGKLVEMMTLRSEDGMKSIGVIHNLTWNYYTNANGGVCQNKYTPAEIYKTFHACESKDAANALILTKMGKNEEYTIEWFNPMTGTKMEVTTIKSDKKGKIKLMYPNLDKNMPFVLYKIYPKGKKFSTLKPVKSVVKSTQNTKSDFPDE